MVASDAVQRGPCLLDQGAHGAAADCAALLEAGVTADGLYWIAPDGADPFEVFCDM